MRLRTAGHTKAGRRHKPENFHRNFHRARRNARMERLPIEELRKPTVCPFRAMLLGSDPARDYE